MKLKEKLDQIFDVKSYGYNVNKWILRFAFLIMLLLFLVVVRVDGWDVAVHGSQAMVCPEDGDRCLNPYVMDCSTEPLPSFGDVYFVQDVEALCDYDYLESGETYGVIPSRLARLFPYLCVALFLFSLLINHLVYNRGFKVKKNEK